MIRRKWQMAFEKTPGRKDAAERLDAGSRQEALSRAHICSLRAKAFFRWVR